MVNNIVGTGITKCTLISQMHSYMYRLSCIPYVIVGEVKKNIPVTSEADKNNIKEYLRYLLWGILSPIAIAFVTVEWLIKIIHRCVYKYLCIFLCLCNQGFNNYLFLYSVSPY